MTTDIDLKRYLVSKGGLHDCRAILHDAVSPVSRDLSVFIDDIDFDSEGYSDYKGKNPTIMHFHNAKIIRDEILNKHNVWIDNFECSLEGNLNIITLSDNCGYIFKFTFESFKIMSLISNY